MARHGQTDYNLKGIVQGSGIDADLNDRGRQQATAFFEVFKDVKFDKVYTSTLKRTKQSVKGFLEMGLPHEEWAGLNEISWGSREGTVITPEEDAYYHDVIKKWQNGETTLRIEGGESPQDVFNRQKPVLEHIIGQEDEKTILVCMHGRAMRVLLCQMLNYPLRCMDMFGHSNLCLYVINFTGSMFSIERFNDTHHLKELVSSRF